jgi:hypothetical protein
MSEIDRHPRAGQVYQFNNIKAKVIGFTEDDVSWQEDGKRTVHQTPRWYFEQHAVTASQ